MHTHPRWHMLAYTVLPDDAVCISECIQDNAIFTQIGLAEVTLSEYFTKTEGIIQETIYMYYIIQYNTGW